MAGFYKVFVKKEGADFPFWADEEAQQNALDRRVERRREDCELGEYVCGLSARVADFSLLEIIENGTKFDASVRLEAFCDASECPNERILLAALGFAGTSGEGVALYDLGRIDEPEQTNPQL